MTDKQELTYAFILRHLKERLRLPTYEEISKGVGYSSAGAARSAVIALCREGLLAHDGKVRNYRPVGVQVELLAQESAGPDAEGG